MSGVSAALTTYRVEAAARFSRLQSATHRAARQGHVTPYQRESFSGLSSLLQLLAERYRSHQARGTCIEREKSERTSGRMLGYGVPRTGFWRERKVRCQQLRMRLRGVPVARYMKRKEERLQERVHTYKGTSIEAERCAYIPRDVLLKRESLYRTFCIQRTLHEAAVRTAPFESCAPIRDGRGYSQYVVRARKGFLNRRREVLPLRVEGTKCKVDCAEEVMMRYGSMPDEIYRRKSARRYAVWKRLRREEEERHARYVRRAEAEMRKRRGHDLTLSSLDETEKCFKPFVFEQEENAYAFSSKISQAPKLRKTMLTKYSVPAPQAPVRELDSLQRAQLVAETKSLFHTRVMNRFE